MNISSAIVLVQDQSKLSIIEKIGNLNGCDIHLSESNKLIVTIEAENTDGESKIMKEVQQISGVLSVNMVYSYSENELDQIRKNLDNAQDIPDWLNDETVTAKKIPYSGNLKF